MERGRPTLSDGTQRVLELGPSEDMALQSELGHLGEQVVEHGGAVPGQRSRGSTVVRRRRGDQNGRRDVARHLHGLPAAQRALKLYRHRSDSALARGPLHGRAR